MERERLDKNMSVLYNELFVQINSLPKYDNVDLPICSAICSSLFEVLQKRKRGDNDYYNKNNNNNNGNNNNNNYSTPTIIVTTITITVIITTAQIIIL
jgi:hypothetical protein